MAPNTAIRAFLLHLLLWSGGLIAAQLLLGAWSEGRGVFSHLPVWTGLAFGFAAYPAGIAAAASAFPDDRPSPPAILRFAVVTGALVLAVFVLRGWIAPVLVTGTPSWTDLRATTTRLLAQTDEAGEGTPAAWFELNDTGWRAINVVTGAAIPGLFAWIGLLVGGRARGVRPNELRRLQYWLIGFCLIASTYFAAENTYEMVVLQATGPVFPVAWLHIVPAAVLLCGLGWSTAIDTWRTW